jgi:hypothetical protein
MYNFIASSLLFCCWRRQGIPGASLFGRDLRGLLALLGNVLDDRSQKVKLLIAIYGFLPGEELKKGAVKLAYTIKGVTFPRD